MILDDIFESVQPRKPTLSEGVMDRLRRIYMGLVYDTPMGTPDSEFLEQWQRIIKDRLGQNIDINTLAKLKQNFRDRYKTMSGRGDVGDWHREMGMREEVDTGEHDARKTQPSSKEHQDKVFAQHRERVKNLDQDREQDVEEGVNAKQIKKDLDSGMSYDAVIGKHANKRMANTDEIRRVIQQHAWEKRMKRPKEQGVAEGFLGDREYNRVMPVVKRIASEVSDYDRDEFGEELWSLLDQKYGSKFAQSVLQDSLDFYWDEYTELTSQQGVAEGHADQQRKIVKKAGKPVGEIGIDRESSPGAGMYYMKHYASGLDLGGYDSFEEAMDELRYAIKQSVSEAIPSHIRPSDIPPAMRNRRLTMRDIEAERPEGAFRFRVGEKEFMDLRAAQSFAAGTGQSVERISGVKENKKKESDDVNKISTSARTDRMLTQLRIKNPQAKNDLEALIYDLGKQRIRQDQDDIEIARLDQENDQEEEEINSIERELQMLKKQRAVAEQVEIISGEFQGRRATVIESRRGFLTLDIEGFGKHMIHESRVSEMQTDINRFNTNRPMLPSGIAKVKYAQDNNIYDDSRVQESLRPGEWYDAVVTFDDGTKETVHVTGDEGFRDRLIQHFRRQGKTVTDIDVDWTIRGAMYEKKDRSPGKISRSEDPCWTGYHMVGTKKKNGREVPNCVPREKGD